MTDSPYSKKPWWVEVVYKIGIPSAIAIFLVWFLATQVRERLEAVDNKQNQYMITLNQHITSTDRLANQNERMLRIMQQICINSGTNNQERNECFQ